VHLAVIGCQQAGQDLSAGLEFVRAIRPQKRADTTPLCAIDGKRIDKSLADVAVLTWLCWQHRFGGDPEGVGRTVKIQRAWISPSWASRRPAFSARSFTPPHVFFPMMMQKQLEGGSGYLENRDTQHLRGGPLKPGVSMACAEIGLNGVALGLAQQYPRNDDRMKIVLTPPGLAGNYIRGPVIGFAAALFGVSCLVLLLACTNLGAC
jgi:hypothetical protein